MRRTAATAAFAILTLATAGAAQHTEPKFRRVVVDAHFRSEGIAVADVNGDGKRDLLVGDFWYEVPAWTAHRIRPGPDYGDGAHSWSNCFQCFADDIDRDGHVDEIVVEFPGKRGLWYRNPGTGAADGMWEMHVFADGVANESPQWVDLFGDGRMGLLCGSQPDGGIVWITPGADPTARWDRVAIGGPQSPGSAQFAHGIGCGDLDGDGRNDVFVTDGFWTQPAARTDAPWPFTATPLGGPCAQMHALDVDGDGLADIVSSSAHARGVWWQRQQRGSDGARAFSPGDVLTTITQTHALCIADLDGDGRQDLVTGKRFWAHGPDGDEDPAGTPYLVWIAIERGANGAPTKFVPHVIDDASGVGTQFEVTDVDGDGRLDVAVANKKGVFVFLQEPPAAPPAAEPWVTYRGTAGPGLGKTIVFVTGDEEYRGEESMPQMARLLAERLGFTCTVLFAIDPATGAIDPDVQTNIPGMDALAQADLMVVLTRFRDLPDAQMQPFVDYVESGRPIVGLRTATHAFDVREHPKWKRWSWRNDEWDGGFGRQVLGETWIAHHGDHGSQSTRGIPVAAAATHPILRGIAAGDVWDPADVYTVRLPLPDGCEPLLEGDVLDGMQPDAPTTKDTAKNDPRMPIAWTRLWRAPNGRDARVFTATIGSAQAFLQPGTRRLFVHACLWCLGMDDAIRADLDVRLVGDYAPSRFGFGSHKKGVKPADLAVPH